MKKKLEPPEGYEFESFDPNTQIISYRKLNPFKEFESFYGVLNFHGISFFSFLKITDKLNRKVKALLSLDLLSTALSSVDDKSKKTKFYLSYDYDYVKGYRVLEVCEVGCLSETICFSSREAAEFVKENYEEIYRDLY